MAVSTTQSIWRSGGGDQTRTAYCGSGAMVASFYLASASATANFKVAPNGPSLILPAGAVVLSVSVQTPGSGTINIGTTGYTSGTSDITFIGEEVDVSVKGTVGLSATAGLSGNILPEMSYVTNDNGTGGSGVVSGYITYFVVDPYLGQQNV